MSPSVKSSIKYIFFGLFAFVVFLVVKTPAGFVYELWNKYGGTKIPLAVNGIDGTIWSGTVKRAEMNGQAMEQIRWSLNPMTLVLGIVELDWELKVKDGYAKGIAGVSLLGGAYLQNVEAWLPLPEVQKLFNVEVFRPEGALDIKLGKLKMDNAAIVSVNGDIAWHSAAMTILQKLDLGDLHVALTPSEEGVKGVLSDQGGPLQAEGILVLKDDKSYEFNGAFSARHSEPNLVQALRSLGRPDKDGKYKVSQKGNLSALGL